mmetsp:Transcript_16391/g.41984  ORF Transcript_16391/g.41984 Transcript_16391/m.41984 type:complete len:236 (+) Transcript_16391:791-1498(+)
MHIMTCRVRERRARLEPLMHAKRPRALWDANNGPMLSFNGASPTFSATPMLSGLVLLFVEVRALLLLDGLHVAQNLQHRARLSARAPVPRARRCGRGVLPRAHLQRAQPRLQFVDLKHQLRLLLHQHPHRVLVLHHLLLTPPHKRVHLVRRPAGRFVGLLHHERLLQRPRALGLLQRAHVRRGLVLPHPLVLLQLLLLVRQRLSQLLLLRAPRLGRALQRLEPTLQQALVLRPAP